MSGWYILIRFGICTWGVAVFLRLVANEIEMANEALRLYEQRERKAYEKRHALGVETGAMAEEAA
ncbi:MAG: hypothetical protein JSU86_17855 [Phycisphaerales bacterium]|nr:MAG: hypothetical protein JSU86_17855 [Phycisphaerales bacterium]